MKSATGTMGFVGAALLAVLAAGCGGSGSTGADGGGNGGMCKAIQPGASMSWTFNGTSFCAETATATLLKSTTLEYLSVTGAKGTGVGVSFTVTTPPGTLVPGTYACGTADGGKQIVVLNYQTDLQTPSLAPECAITVTTTGAAGTHATGTFTATIPAGTVTSGVFDMPATVVGG